MVEDLSHAKVFRCLPEGNRKSVGIFKQMSCLMGLIIWRHNFDKSVQDRLVWGKTKEGKRRLMKTRLVLATVLYTLH